MRAGNKTLAVLRGAAWTVAATCAVCALLGMRLLQAYALLGGPRDPPIGVGMTVDECVRWVASGEWGNEAAWRFAMLAFIPLLAACILSLFGKWRERHDATA